MIVNEPLRIYDGCLINGIIWGYSNYLKAVVAINAETFEIVNIIDTKESVETVYKKIVCFERKLYMFPAYGEKILKYSIDSGQLKALFLQKEKKIMISTADVIRKGNCVYVIPLRIDTPFFIMDLYSEKRIVENRWNYFVADLLQGKPYFSTTSFLYGDVIISPCTYTNMVVLYDIRQQTIEKVSLKINDDTIFSLTGHQNSIYISGNCRDKIYVWTIGSVEIQEIIISDISMDQALYYRMYVNGANLFLFPNRSKMIKIVDLIDGSVVSKIILPILSRKVQSVLMYGMIKCDEKLILLPLILHSITTLGLENRKWQRFPVMVRKEKYDKYFKISEFEMEEEVLDLKEFLDIVTTTIDNGKSREKDIYENTEHLGKKILDCVSFLGVASL